MRGYYQKVTYYRGSLDGPISRGVPSTGKVRLTGFSLVPTSGTVSGSVGQTSNSSTRVPFLWTLESVHRTGRFWSSLVVLKRPGRRESDGGGKEV